MTTLTQAAFDQQIVEIEQLITARNLATAAQRLTTLGRQAVDHPVVYILGMRLGEAAGNPAGALKSAERAVACAPGWPEAVIELAGLLARQNQAEAAVARAQEAVALAPEDTMMLARAVTVVEHVRDYTTSTPWLRKLTELVPENREMRRLLAANLTRHSEFAEARTLLEAILAEDSDLVNARADRMGLAFRAGETATAQADADWLIAREPDNENFRFWHQRVHGLTPAAQPRDMVTELFDGQADTFDMHLVRGLQYDMPKRAAEIVRAKHPELDVNVLDLGCGTGLVGVYLGKPRGALIGVDLSTQMIEQAARHNLYDRFHQVDVAEALAATPEALYHVITACDVFIYVGDLGAVIPNAFRVLRPDGDFIFSCEAADADGPAFVLRESVRYAHQQSDIETKCRAAGFDAVTVEQIDLRLENGKPIGGFYVVAHKPA